MLAIFDYRRVYYWDDCKTGITWHVHGHLDVLWNFLVRWLPERCVCAVAILWSYNIYCLSKTIAWKQTKTTSMFSQWFWMMVSIWFPYDFHTISIRFPYDFRMISVWFPCFCTSIFLTFVAHAWKVTMFLCQDIGIWHESNRSGCRWEVAKRNVRRWLCSGTIIKLNGGEPICIYIYICIDVYRCI